MQRLVFALALVGLFGCAAATFLALQPPARRALVDLVVEQLDQPASASAQPVRFAVARGESASGIAERLAAAGLIRSDLWFRVYVRMNGVGANLQAGEYLLRPNMRTSEIVAALQDSRAQGVTVTIPEGWRAAEIADLLDEKGVTSRDEFLAVVQSPRLAGDFAFLQGVDDVEGYLFPDTYQLLPGTAAEVVARRMLENFADRVPSSLLAESANIGLTSHEAIVLASVVEREAVHEAERARIAGVFLNRLRRGMRLQADPTVQFAHAGVAPPAGRLYWRPLTRSDLSIESPYNTYLYPGLPPGPICNPGLASITAVLNAEEHDFLYFVARPDHTHVFARTLDEHNRNVRQVQESGESQ